jgi:hypothetical protein
MKFILNHIRARIEPTRGVYDKEAIKRWVLLYLVVCMVVVDGC